MTLTTLMSNIGEDADLLTRCDAWLEQERRTVASQLDEKARELEKLLLAQKIKKLLQQKNLVAVQQILRTAEGDMKDVIIKLMNLPDAIYLLEQQHQETIDEINTNAQTAAWAADGYDVATSRALR
jgi:Cdc6-like AAA superfamily ATPase